MKKEVVVADWQQVTDRLSTLALSFAPETFIRKGKENKWSAAQIAEHLWKVDRSTYHALKSETIPTNRPPEQKIALIREAMESDIKRVAPELVNPSGKEYAPLHMVQQIQQQRELVKRIISELDLTEACKLYRHPSLGTLTRLEWVYFNIYHAERHMRQMKQLRTEMGEA